jgi:acetolactate synthase-1/2/3 large subunit
MKVAEFIINYLEEIGVKDIFTVVGGGSIFLCDALGSSKKINYIACHQEQAASMAAESYARVKNSIGVNIVTSGPGGTNCVTGVAGAWLDHVPHLTISGQVFSKQTIKCKPPGLRTLGVQEINIVDVVKPITKYAVMVTDAQEIKYHLEKAIYMSTHDRPGPVWLDIPADIQNTKIEPNELKGFIPEEVLIDNENLEEQVANVINQIKQSKRPVIHVGQGVRISNAQNILLTILERLHIPILTARNANDIIDSSHELYVGRPGTFAQRGANFVVQTSDLYIAIGTRLSLAQTGYNAKDYARNAKVIMIDIDESELNKDTVSIDTKICSDAKQFLDKLLNQLNTKKVPVLKWESWLMQCKEWQKKYPVVLQKYKEQTKYVNTYYLIELLSEILGPNTIVVTDMGFAYQNTHQAFQIKQGQRLFTNSGLASMGWGLPAAIGAATASREADVICICGDGGFMMNINEMATLMHHKQNIKIFIFNNNGYLTQKQAQEHGFEGRIMGSDAESGISFPDFIQISNAHKIEALRIDTHKDLKEKLIRIIRNNGPFLCDIVMDPNQLQAPKSINRRDEDGNVKQTSLEDSFPFLDNAEIKENMSIIHKI